MSTPDDAALTGDLSDLSALVDRVPEGWSPVVYCDRRYGMSRKTHAAGRSVEIYAEELGGTDVVSTTC